MRRGALARLRGLPLDVLDALVLSTSHGWHLRQGNNGSMWHACQGI